jgi:thiol-disulfide isomerase/thioredoxin
MNNIILFLALAILVVLAYKFWKPYVRAPKREVATGKANLYFFYTDWCGFSQKAMPEWENLEERLKETPYFGTTEVRAVRVNAEEDRKTALLYEVNAYPTILLESSEGITNYSGKRTAEGLLQFLRESFGKESKSL